MEKQRRDHQPSDKFPTTLQQRLCELLTDSPAWDKLKSGNRARGWDMAVVAHIILRGVTPEQYDEVRAECGWLERPPTGGLAHLAWWEGDDNHNIDAWESEEAFQRFGDDRLGPAMAKVGVIVAPEVTFHPAHEVFAPEQLRLV